ncbi:Probable membrane protein Cj0124c [hydrothermal vent metagenome]|uniref:Probable membrane protein Cj0124c n=1 Tax=hydrothermal vent metagenome TaxID=652676 RepID=A0A1W1BHV8_9ZZZZ
MYLKRYSIAAFIWIALVGWYVYAYITQDNMSLDFFGIPLPSLKIALWVVLPLVVLYLVSLFHMAFYSMLGNFRLRNYEKDFEKIVDAIIEAYLGKKSRSHNFKTDRYRLLGTLLEKSTVFPSSELIGTTGNEKIDKVLNIIETIKNGGVADLKPFNLLPENPLVIQNEKNRYKKGEVSVSDILNNCTKYADELCKFVYNDYVKGASLQNVLKYKAFLTKEALQVIMARINADENTLSISNEELIELFEKLELSKEDYIEFSITLSKGGMIPEQRMKLFETLSEEKEEAMDAYLFTLFDLEMIAPANEILDHSQPGEYENFKAYRALKECGKNFSITLFI